MTNGGLHTIRSKSVRGHRLVQRAGAQVPALAVQPGGRGGQGQRPRVDVGGDHAAACAARCRAWTPLPVPRSSARVDRLADHRAGQRDRRRAEPEHVVGPDRPGRVSESRSETSSRSVPSSPTCGRMSSAAPTSPPRGSSTPWATARRTPGPPQGVADRRRRLGGAEQEQPDSVLSGEPSGWPAAPRPARRGPSARCALRPSRSRHAVGVDIRPPAGRLRAGRRTSASDRGGAGDRPSPAGREGAPSSVAGGARSPVLCREDGANPPLVLGPVADLRSRAHPRRDRGPARAPCRRARRRRGPPA